MKKLFIILFITALLTTGCFVFSACNRKNNEEQHEHNYIETVVNPTCMQEGYTLHKCDCGKEYKDTFVVATGHNYNAPTYVWNGQSCTATRICKNDGNHKETETVTGVYVLDTNATCTACEKGHYKASFANVNFSEQNTQANGIDNGTALDHNFEWVVDKPATKIETGLKHEKCTRCNATRNENTIIPILTCGHESAQMVKGKPATCTEQGEKDYWYCENCQKYFSDSACQMEIETNIEDWKVIPAITHNYGTPTYTWNGKFCTAKMTCINGCGHFESETAEGIYVLDTPATYSTPEKGHYLANFNCKAYYSQTTAKDSVINGEPLNHNIETPIIED